MIHTLIRLLNTVYRGMFYMKNRIAKERGRWFAEHTDLILEEKRKVFESNLFPKEIQKEGDLL